MVHLSRVEVMITDTITSNEVIKMKSNISKIYYHFSLHKGANNKLYPKLQDVEQLTSLLDNFNINYKINYNDEQLEFIQDDKEDDEENT